MKKILILAILLILTACGGRNETIPYEPTTPPATTTPAPQPLPTEPTPDRWADYAPLLWRATSPAGQTMYLFGTIHAARADAHPLPQFIMDALGRSDYLALEISILENLDEATYHSARFRYTDGRDISYDISEELFDNLMAVKDEHYLHGRGILTTKPGMAAMSLEYFALERVGMFTRYGIDMLLEQYAMMRGMNILEIESIALQTDVLAGFSMPLQIALLEMALDFEEAAQSGARLMDAWQRGDGAGVWAYMERTRDAIDEELWVEFYDALLVQRDIGMTARAREFMAEGKKVFFTAGAAHFLHEGSIIALLEEAGYEIVRVMP
ncbi:MAG: TraB/GumN family protein [Clostridiales bacterium]|jgi:uncharacterized protein YbaP (TraB family)|nr:TraB/GumN family protein [Clostridiales bacterium]